MSAKKLNLAQKLLCGVGGLSIVVGGVISAFLPDEARSFDTWLVAYLVLVAGVAQVAIGWGLSKLPAKKIATFVWTIFLSFNIGNWLVVSGALIRETLFVMVGGALIAFAMVIALTVTRGAKRTFSLYVYMIIVGIVLLSVPVGVILSTLHG